jgi:hypothetical protein
MKIADITMQVTGIVGDSRVNTWNEFYESYFGCMIINRKNELFVFSQELGDISFEKMSDIANNKENFESMADYRFITKDAVTLCLPPERS